MATAHKVCRICGKSYEACHSLKTGVTALDWKAVACSPAHGEKYFTMIAESRRKPEEKRVPGKKKEEKEDKADKHLEKVFTLGTLEVVKESEKVDSGDEVASLVSSVVKK